MNFTGICPGKSVASIKKHGHLSCLHVQYRLLITILMTDCSLLL